VIRPPFRRRRWQLTCQQAVELVTDYLDGVLPARERERFDAHLADCAHCTRYLNQMRTTIETLGRLEPESVPPEVLRELVTVYRRIQQDRRAED
jgi:anti-sigma factor RsiW